MPRASTRPHLCVARPCGSLYGAWPVPDAPTGPARRLTVGATIALVIVDLLVVGGVVALIWFLASR